MNGVDFRKIKYAAFGFDHERKSRYCKLDFEGFYELKAKSIDRIYIPSRLQLKFTDKYLNFHAVGELWGKYSEFERYKFITALRIDKSSATLQYYGDFKNVENKTKSFFFIEFLHRRRFILHYFHDFMPEFDNKWMFVHSMLNERKVIEAKKTILNQLD
jgi:hypothetical protein